MSVVRSLAVGAMVLFCCGADAPTATFKKTTTHPAAETIGQLFDAMREGDAARIPLAYAPRAWTLISGVGPDENGVELPQRLKQRMAKVESVEAVSSRDDADGKGATIKVKITQPPAPEETVNVFLSKDDGGDWKVDYPGEVEVPFCLDDWVGLFLVWDVSYRAAKEINDPRGWYEQVLVGVRRGWALADARPQDVATLYAVGGVYFDLLGFGERREVSRPAVRKETLDRDGGDVARARTAHPKLLDASGKLLPEVAAKLPYLAAYPDGFPHGIPPTALAYDFNKRAQVAQAEGRRHLQLSPMVIDSRPALTLKAWGQDEYDLARRLEGDVATSDEAVFAFRRSAHVFGDAADEYERHVKAYPKNQRTYASHLSEVRAAGAAAIADADFLRAMNLKGKARDEARKAAKENYAKAREAYKAIVALYPDPADEEDRADYQAKLEHVTRRLKLLDPP